MFKREHLPGGGIKNQRHWTSTKYKCHNWMQNVDNTLIYEKNVFWSQDRLDPWASYLYSLIQLYIYLHVGENSIEIWMVDTCIVSLSAYSVSFPDSTKANTVKALIKVLSKCNYNPQRWLVWSEINYFRLLRAPWLERCLPIKVVLTPCPFAQVFDVSLNALPVISAQESLPQCAEA